MNVAILSSSSNKVDDYYINLARKISDDLAGRGFDLVFGGCSDSMMGACYQEFSKYNRKILSFTNNKYTSDIINLPNAKHKIVDSTFDLKKEIFDNSDLILALAGGIGTLSEVLSFVEENRSNDKDIPIVIYDCNHYYYYLFEQLKVVSNNNFFTDEMINLITNINTHEEFTKYIDNFIEERKMVR